MDNFPLYPIDILYARVDTTVMKNTAKIDTDKPAMYECTLCRKVHRVSQQSRGFGTDKYSMHYEWRIGGKYEIAR